MFRVRRTGWTRSIGSVEPAKLGLSPCNHTQRAHMLCTMWIQDLTSKPVRILNFHLSLCAPLIWLMLLIGSRFFGESSVVFGNVFVVRVLGLFGFKVQDLGFRV